MSRSEVKITLLTSESVMLFDLAGLEIADLGGAAIEFGVNPTQELRHQFHSRRMSNPTTVA